MTRRTLAALWDEVNHLQNDLVGLAPDLVTQMGDLFDTEPVPSRIVLSGSGDSLFAAEAASYSFGLGTRCTVQSTQLLWDYGPPVSGEGSAGGGLVVGLSASGGNECLAEGLVRARAEGHRTLAIVGHADGPVGRSADGLVLAALPARPPAPGVRSYQASLLAILLLAGRRQPGGATPADELTRLPGHIGAAIRRQAEPCRQLAEHLRGTPVVHVLGGGPSFGTARYVAAKLVEGAGVPAMGQDLEEWWHLERFATERDAPLIILAPPGPSHARAVRLCAQARDRGHFVAVLADPADPGVQPSADLLIPLPEGHSGTWSVLVEHVFAAPLAAELAALLGRHPFHRR